MRTIYLSKSTHQSKKFMIETDKFTVHFGAAGYEDYTMHRNAERKTSYIRRHQARENWTASGVNTAGFWSRWLLWNRPTLKESMKDIENRFGLKIVQN